MNDAERILASLDSLGTKVDAVKDDVHAIRSDHGSRLTALETSAAHLPVQFQSAFREALAAERETWRAALAAERASWQAALNEDRRVWSERVEALERQRDQHRGAAWAFGVVWTFLVAAPGIFALWFGSGGSGSSSSP